MTGRGYPTQLRTTPGKIIMVIPGNWAIEQGPDGLIYAANTDGLLVFDVNVWQKIYTS